MTSVESFTGHVDVMKKQMDNNSSRTCQNQVKLFEEEVDGHLQLLMSKK